MRVALPTVGWVLLNGCAHHTAARAVPPVPANAIHSTFRRQAINAADKGDGDYRIRELRARLEANSKDISVRLELADHYRKGGFPEVAIEHLRLASEASPDSAETRVALAKILRQEDRRGEAVNLLRAFSSTHGSDVEVWAWLGLLEDETGDWKAGEAAHRRAVALAPKRADLLNNLGYCLLEQKRSAEAAETFRAALALDPDSKFARNNLGLALAANPTEAVATWQASSGPAGAHSNMAAAHMEQGRYSEARAELQKALSIDGSNGAALNNLRILQELDGPTPVPFVGRPMRRWFHAVTWWKHRSPASRTDEKKNEKQLRGSNLALASPVQGKN